MTMDSWTEFPNVEAKPEESWETFPTPKEKPLVDISDTLSGAGHALSGLTTTVPHAFRQLGEGLENPWKRSEGYKSSAEAMQKYNEETEAAEKAAEESGDASVLGSGMRQAGSSLGFSGGAMGASLLGSSAAGTTGRYIGGLAGPEGAVAGEVVGRGLGALGASYGAAYRMAGAQFLDDAKNELEAKFQQQLGRPMTEKEQDEAYAELKPLAEKFGHAEAGPEAIGNLAMGLGGKYVLGLGRKAITKMASDSLIKTGAKKLAAGTAAEAVELGGETATQVEQSRIEREKQALLNGQDSSTVAQPDRSMAEYGKALGEVAPATIAQSLLGLGAGAVYKGAKSLLPAAPQQAETLPGETPAPVTLKTPVVVNDTTIAYIPADSTLTPDEVADFAEEPETLKRWAAEGKIHLPEVGPPIPGVNTAEMDENIAASAALAPQTADALRQETPADVFRQKLEEQEKEAQSEEIRMAQQQSQAEQAAAFEAEQRQKAFEALKQQPQVSPVTAETETPSSTANAAGGSQSVQTESAEGSIPAVTEGIVPSPEEESTAEIQPTPPNATGTKPLEESVYREPAPGDQSGTTESPGPRDQLLGAEEERGQAPSEIDIWAPTINAPATFTAPNGQKVVGTVDSVTPDGTKARVTYPWNGKTVSGMVPVSQLSRPVASMVEPPSYQYTQEQNTRKAGKHIPVTPGVHSNFDFRKAFASMAEDTSLSRIYREIARIMSKMPEFSNVDLHIVADGRRKYAGEYTSDRGKPAIAVNLRQVARGKVDALGTLLHEGLHHATLAKVRDPRGDVELEVVQALNDIRSKLLKLPEAARFDYELGSNEEFITGVFTHPGFQDFLASLPADFAPSEHAGKFRSLLSEIFRLIMQLVTRKYVARDSTLDQSGSTILALFETPHRMLDLGPLQKLSAAESKPETYQSPTSMLADTAAKLRGEAAEKPAGLSSMFNPQEKRPATGERTLFETPKPAEVKPADVTTAYQKAQVGRSTAWVPIKDVYEKAKEADPSLTPEAFMAQINEQNDKGEVYISPVEQLSTVQAAQPFVVGAAGVEMLVPGATPASGVESDTDAEYMQAVRDGDVAKQQAMVDAAAKSAGYKHGPVWHGSRYGFQGDAFDKSKSWGPGFFFSSSEKVAKRFAGRGKNSQVLSFYIKSDNPAVFNKSVDVPITIDQLFEEIGLTAQDVPKKYANDVGQTEIPAWRWYKDDSLLADLNDLGFDAFKGLEQGETVWGLWNPNQIKSADPVTYDANGQPIPLSQRFNPQSPSTLYSLAEEEGPPTIDIGGEAEPADGGGTQLYQKRPTAIGKTYATPADITLQERRSQEETLAKARKIIGESVAQDPKGGRRAARDRFRLDTSLPPEVRAAGLGLIARQADALANEAEGLQQEELDDLSDESAQLAGIFGSDPESFRNLKADANLDIDKMAEEAGRTLNIFNVFRRLTPEGFLRRMTRKYNDAVRERLEQNFDRPAGEVEAEVKEAVKTKPADPEKAVKDLMKSLKPKPRAPREKIEKSLKTLFTADTVGALDSQAFFDAFGEAFGLPPLSGEQQAKVKKLVREVNSLPKGPARLDKQQELDEEMALWKGIAARDVLLSAWYANILSGISTQGMGILGNSINLFLRSTFNALSNPRSAGAYLKGALGEGLATGIEEAKAALKGKGLYKVSKYGDKNLVSALELLRKKGPSTLPEWVAYIASAGTRLRYVFRIMQAIDALAWNTAREGHAYLAAHRALLEQQKQTGEKLSPEEFYKQFVDSLGGDTAQIEEDLRAARQTLVDAGKVPDLLTVDRMAREARNARRTAGGIKGANRFADRIVLQQEPEGSGKFITSLIDAFQKKGDLLGLPLGQMLVPFNKIVSNLFEQSLDYTPVGALRAILGGHLSDLKSGSLLNGKVEFKEKAQLFDQMERRERGMAAVAGMSAAAIAYALANSFKDDPDEDAPFMVYGWGPESKTKRSQMPKGWQPYSVKIGDQYYKFSEMPFGMLFAAAGSAMDAVRYKNMDKKTASERLGYVLKTAAKGFMNQGVMSSLDNAMESLMFQASDKKITDIPVNAVKGLVPAQGLLRDISSIFDPNKVSNESLTSALLRDIPFAKGYATKPDLNVFGEPVKMDGYPIVRRLITHREPHAVADYLGRNDLHIPGMDQTIEIGQYLPKQTHDRIKRRAIELGAMENGLFTPEQNYEFKKRAGHLTKAIVEDVMKAVPKVSNDAQRKLVQGLIDKRVENARRRAMLEAVPVK